MIGYLLSLSLLIAAVLLIRALFRKSVSPRAIYALWLAVVVRMLLPFSLFEVKVQMPSWAQGGGITQTETQDTQAPSQEAVGTVQAPSGTVTQITPTIPTQSPTQSPTPASPVTPTTPEQNVQTPTTAPDRADTAQSKAFSLAPKDVANLVWLIGAIAVATWFLFASVSFERRLCRDRRLHKTVNKTKVYISENAGVPCIAGIVPSIYITPETASNPSETLIVIHEYTHLRHGDHIWSLLRALALAVFWYNPLIWAAAVLSKRDAELACDDAMAAKLSEDNRLRYAHVLLETAPQRHGYAVGLGSAPLKERILMLTTRQKNRWVCLLLALVLCVTAVGCSFVRISEKEDTDIPNKNEGGSTIAVTHDDFVRGDIPSHFSAFYHEAERVYALFTGYRFDIYTDDTYDDGEAQYRSVDIDGCASLTDLRRLCARYFDTALTDRLLSTTVMGKYPLYTEHDGRLYRYDGYVALFDYEAPENYEMSLKVTKGDTYTVRVCADLIESGHKITAEGLCTYTVTDGDDMRFTSFSLMAEELATFLPQPTDYLPLTPILSSDKVSLYYSVESPEATVAREFLIVFGEHEVRIRTAMPAHLTDTWEPQIYLNDLSLPGVAADGTDDAVLIFTTGTGTGMHIEEAYVIDGASGFLTVIKAPYQIAEQAVHREADGKCTLTDAHGNTVSLPDNAYFTEHFRFYLGAKSLYAEVSIGYGMLSYLEDHILVTYSADGITWAYVNKSPMYRDGIEDMRVHGPYVGYVASRETPWIELYTERDGTYVGRIPYEIFHDWIATDRDREGWTPGWMNTYIPFYYAEFGDFRWAGVHLADTVLGSGRKNIATSADGGETWTFGSTRDDYGGNHVVGMGFISDTTAFMSFEPNNEHDGAQGPVISRTTDGGKTWEVLDIPVPAAFAGDKLISGIPFFDGDVLYYPVWAEPSHGTRIGDAMYLVSYDKGLTWAWDETSVKSAAAGYASIPSAALDWQMAEQQSCISIAVAAEEVVFVRWQEGAGPYAVIETKSGELYAATQNEDGYTAFYQIDTSYKDTALLKTYQNVFGEYGLCLSYTVGANASDICYFTLEDDMPTHVLICNKDAVTVADIILEAYGSMGAQINVYRKENGALFMCDLNQAVKELFPEAKQLYLHRVSNHRYHHYELTFRIEIPENTYDYYGWFSNGALHLISEELLNT